MFGTEVKKLEYSSVEERYFYKVISENSGSINMCAFENNWPYIVQSTRYQGYMYKVDGNVFYFWLRKYKTEEQLVIVQYFGKKVMKCIQQFSESLKKEGVYTIIKNVDTIAELKKWSLHGFHETIQAWSNYSYRDDNTLPSYSALTQDILDLNIKPSRSKTRRIINKIHRERDIHISLYDDSYQEESQKLLQEYARFMGAKGVDEQEQVYDAHKFFFDESIEHAWRMVVMENGKIIALSYFTPYGDVLFANAIINRNESNLMRYVLWASLHYLHTEGYILPKFLSFQGSENEGQHFWKECFKPVREIHQTHVTNRA